MKYPVLICMVLLNGLALAMGSAAPRSWVGTWRLDESRSQPIGPTFIYTRALNGQYTVNTGDHVYRFFCDGKDYPTVPQHSVSCTESTHLSMQMTYKISGQTTGHAVRTLSPDGGTLTVTSTSVSPNDSKQVHLVSYRRISVSTGFVGAWVDTDQSAQRPPLFVITETGLILHLNIPGKNQHTDIPLNGADAQIQGLSSGVHATLSAKKIGEGELFVEQKLDGRVLRDTSMTMSQDGRTLIQEVWRPENPSQKERLVYQRQ
jgi:hypothetical protein